MGTSRAPIGIATKVTLLLCVIVLVSTSVVGFTMYWRFSQTLLAQELRELSALARNKSTHFTAQIDSLRADVEFLAHSPDVQGMIRARQAEGVDPELLDTEEVLHDRMAAVFTQLLDAKPNYFQARLIGVEDGGREIVRVERINSGGQIKIVRKHELQQKGNEPYFEAAIRLGEDDVYLSEINLNREHGRVAEPSTPVLRAAAAVYDPDGRVAAILVINRLLQPLFDSLRGEVTTDGKLLITNDQGEYLVHPDPLRCFAFDFGRSSRIQQDYPEVATAFATHDQPTMSVISGTNRGERTAIGVYKAHFDPQHPGRFIAFALAEPYDRLVAESTQILHQAAWISSALLFVSVTIGCLLSRSVTKPLRQITSAAEAFGRGERNVEMPTTSRDETGILARTLNVMMDRVAVARRELECRAQELEEARGNALTLLKQVESVQLSAVAAEQAYREQAARTQAILDGASDAIITICIDGIIESFNAAAERMFGYRAEEIIGRNIKTLIPQPYRDEYDQYLQNYLEFGVAKITGTGREAVGLRADETTFPLDLAVSEVRLGDKRILTGIVRDISALQHASQQLEQANVALNERSREIKRFNVELSRSNEELKQFAYVASHDLQEPLRKVTAFCQLLRAEYSDQLDENAQTYIRHAVDGAARMKTLVQDLLSYSHVETLGKPLSLTDAKSACIEAIENLSSAIEESAAEVTLDPLPSICADRVQLVRLFQNLIGNAIKYRGSEPPRIHVGAEEVDGQWSFRIRDNGIGIDPQYFERIFVIFQRLHARNEYSGTGIGLAVCKRIVERFGGRIWVESNAGAGSVFCVAFPMPAEELGELPEGNRTHGHDIRETVAAAD